MLKKPFNQLFGNKIENIVSTMFLHISFQNISCLGSKEIMKHIDEENRLLRPHNLVEPAPGKGFEIFTTKKILRLVF